MEKDKKGAKAASSLKNLVKALSSIRKNDEIAEDAISQGNQELLRATI